MTTWLHLETEWITLGHHLETRCTPQEHQLEQHSALCTLCTVHNLHCGQSALCTLCTAHIPLPSQAPRPTWWWVHKWAVEPDYPIPCGHFVLKTNTLNSMVWLFMFYWQIFTNIVHDAYLWIEPPGYFMPPTPSLPMPLLSSGGKEAKQVNVRRVLFHTVPHSATLFHIVPHCATLCHIVPHSATLICYTHPTVRSTIVSEALSCYILWVHLFSKPTHSCYVAWWLVGSE